MSFQLELTSDARQDIEDHYRFITTNDSRVNANKVLDAVLKRVDSLEELPERGEVVPELRDSHGEQYRQVFVHSHRLIYTVIDSTVFIMLYCDGRRDMESLLHRRLMAR